MFKKGFTLIELLVVIAIIAILAAILFPVFAQAREKARQTSCLSNCKQMGTALQLYVDDYDETVPSAWYSTKNWDTIDHTTYAGYPCSKYTTTDWNLGQTGNKKHWTWADCIFPYVKNLKMYECPSGNKDSLGYGYNIVLDGLDGTRWNSLGAKAFDGDTNSNPCSLSQLKNSAELVFVCDTQGFKGNGACTAFTCLPANIDSDISAAGGINPIRHNEGMNFVFCDGHAKYYKKCTSTYDSAGYFTSPGPACTTGWGIGQLSQWWDPNHYK